MLVWSYGRISTAGNCVTFETLGALAGGAFPSIDANARLPHTLRAKTPFGSSRRSISVRADAAGVGMLLSMKTLETIVAGWGRVPR